MYNNALFSMLLSTYFKLGALIEYLPIIKLKIVFGKLIKTNKMIILS